jgi:NAD(P)-dependent dehydrogenase (short-subunit alcohol dehydrogenase family)
MEYTGKVAVITGGASGIGKGIVHALLERGATVVVADIEQGVLDATVAEFAGLGTIRGVRCDVTDAASITALADDVYAREGGVDLLFANAGVTSGGGGLPWEQEMNDWRWCFSVNVFGVAGTVLEFLPRMLEAGRPAHLITTSSGDGGIAPVPHASIYAASKAAISCFTESLAHQLTKVDAPVHAHVFYPGGGLLDTGLWTAQRNRPDELARVKPRPPAPGTTFEEFREQLKAAGMKADVVDLNWLGDFVLDAIAEGKYVIAPNTEQFGPLLHRRADAIAQGQVPPTLIH